MRVRGAWNDVVRRGGRVRDGGGGGVNGGRIVRKKPSDAQHFLVIYLTKVTPQTNLKLEQDELMLMILVLMANPNSKWNYFFEYSEPPPEQTEIENMPMANQSHPDCQFFLARPG